MARHKPSPSAQGNPSGPKQSRSCGNGAISPDTVEDRVILGSIIDHSDDAIICKDLHGIIIKWNKAAERIFGYRRKEIVGESIMRLIPPERLAEERMILRRLRQRQQLEHYETVRIRKDGRPIYVSVSISPIVAPDGSIIGACKIARDITERKKSDEAREHSELMLRAILNTAADAIISIDENAKILAINAATEQLFGYKANELIGANVNRLMPEPYHREHDGYVRQYCRTGRAKIIGIGREVTGLRKDGTTFPMHLAVSEVKLQDQRLFTGIVHDLTGRRQLERQIMETAANEQRRIGQDLHDGLCQDLVGIAFGIDGLTRILPASVDKEPIAKLAAAVRDAAGQARRLAHGLNPVDLKAGGLATALENLAHKVAASFGVRCIFQWDHAAQVTEDATATHLYRVAQEALSNAIRHGKATRIRIGFNERNKSLVLSITDNGKGIPPPVHDTVKKGLVLTGVKAHAGIGMQTMHYRARVMGGTFSVVPGKRGGTTVICVIPRDQSSLKPAIPTSPSVDISGR